MGEISTSYQNEIKAEISQQGPERDEKCCHAHCLPALSFQDIRYRLSPCYLQDCPFHEDNAKALWSEVLSAGLLNIADVPFVGIARQLDYRKLSFVRRLLCAGIEHNRHGYSNCSCISGVGTRLRLREGCIAVAATLAFLFLSTTKNLQKLVLAIENLVDGDLVPVFGVGERQRATGSILQLQHLPHRAHWSHIRNIQLEIATDRTTLVTFLLAHKNTLRLLTLTQTSLVRLRNPRNTWESTLTNIGQGLRLESLTLAKLTDTLVDWAPGV
ncbi:hypothetical protein IQ07DRAFT_669069 [Pyrenochaeta sp. DS3sAY3a]|nr:hypothetical protein IQ07DRAFT_669069 [Pyrenochaeta sp. DS3sAY3a]